MRFLADECCAVSLVEALRLDGHDVTYVGEGFAGLTDEEVLDHALKERRLLLTEDKDFGDLTVRLQKPAIGLILLRLNPNDHELKIIRLRRLITDYGDRLAGHYSVVGRDRFRFRPLPNPLL